MPCSPFPRRWAWRWHGDGGCPTFVRHHRQLQPTGACRPEFTAAAVAAGPIETAVTSRELPLFISRATLSGGEGASRLLSTPPSLLAALGVELPQVRLAALLGASRRARSAFCFSRVSPESELSRVLQAPRPLMRAAQGRTPWHLDTLGDGQSLALCGSETASARQINLALTEQLQGAGFVRRVSAKAELLAKGRLVGCLPFARENLQASPAIEALGLGPHPDPDAEVASRKLARLGCWWPALGEEGNV